MAHRQLTFLALLGIGSIGACSENASPDMPSNGGVYAPTPGSGGSSSNGTGGGANTPPPEKEAEDTYTAPVVSGHWIWTANPLSGKVALIDATTLRVTTADAGLAPTYVAGLGANDDDSAAIVLNVGNDTASVLHATAGVIDVETVKVHPGANRMTVSPSGRWALVWSDATLLSNPDPTEGLQDVTVVDLASSPPASTSLTVGYRPSRVSIGSGEKHAYFVTEPGISVVDLPKLDPPSVSRDVSVASDPTEAASIRDVTVTPDGAFAIVRRENQPTVNVVSLTSSTSATVTLPGPVTDLDLSPQGDVAFAVVRGMPASTGTGGTTSTGGTGGTSGAGGSSATAGTAGGGTNSAGTTGAAGSDAGGAPAGGANEGGAAGANGGEGGETAGAPSAGGAANGGESGGSPEAGAPAAAGANPTGAGGTASGAGGGSGVPATPEPSFVAALPLATILKHPSSYQQVEIPDIVGSIAIAPTGDVAVLYTNATDSDHVLILDTKALKITRTVLVQSPVDTVLPAPDGQNAVALLRKAAGSQKAGGFSLVSLASTLPPKIVGTDAPPLSVALGSSQALITVDGTDPSTQAAVHAVYLAQLPGFGTTKITLASPPVSAGLIPEVTSGFVSQSHPEGRITFVNLTTGQPTTITGFELSARVMQ